MQVWPATEEEYLAHEEKTEWKHEYWNGQMWEMPHVSMSHCQIVTNLSVALWPHLRGTRFYAAMSRQRLKVEETGLRTWPDFVIADTPLRFDQLDPVALLNPQIIVEVLSPASWKYDRTVKFDHYRQIPSLTDYIFIEQDWVRVEHYRRAEGRLWTIETFNQRDQSLILPDIEIELPLEEIYDGLDLPSGLLLMNQEEN